MRVHVVMKGDLAVGAQPEAKRVFDLDSIQLIKLYAGLADDGSLVGEDRWEGAGTFFLGGVARDQLRQRARVQRHIRGRRLLQALQQPLVELLVGLGLPLQDPVLDRVLLEAGHRVGARVAQLADGRLEALDVLHQLGDLECI